MEVTLGGHVAQHMIRAEGEVAAGITPHSLCPLRWRRADVEMGRAGRNIDASVVVRPHLSLVPGPGLSRSCHEQVLIRPFGFLRRPRRFGRCCSGQPCGAWNVRRSRNWSRWDSLGCSVTMPSLMDSWWCARSAMPWSWVMMTTVSPLVWSCSMSSRTWSLVALSRLRFVAQHH